MALFTKKVQRQCKVARSTMETLSVWHFSYFLTSGLMVCISQMGRHGSSIAIAVVETHTAPVATAMGGSRSSSSRAE